MACPARSDVGSDRTSDRHPDYNSDQRKSSIRIARAAFVMSTQKAQVSGLNPTWSASDPYAGADEQLEDAAPFKEQLTTFDGIRHWLGGSSTPVFDRLIAA